MDIFQFNAPDLVQPRVIGATIEIRLSIHVADRAERPARRKVEIQVSISSVTSSTNTTQNQAAGFSAGLDTTEFLNLLVSQLKNQNPTEPTDTNQLLSQMVSYASYGQQESTNEALADISKTLDGISSALALILQETNS
jgi:flagellar basal-body rod modification protein FlgD